MMFIPRLGILLSLLLLCLSTTKNSVLACTAVLVGQKATIDGSILVSHSDDGEGIADPRIMYVPSRNVIIDTINNEEETIIRRSILPDVEDFPRYVGSMMGPDYESTRIIKKTNDDESIITLTTTTTTTPIGTISIPISFIDNITQTYSYFDGNYGIMNSKQLILGGESTCSAIFSTTAVGNDDGKALLSINELTRIALEYTSTARNAIKLMGYLAETYGFYGPSKGFEGSAESLMIADTMEGFVFHILPDDTGISAIWIAQRVPDHHITVVANMFIIRHVNLTDTYNFLGSSYMYDVAKRNQLWNEGDGLLDFTKTFSNGEYGHKYYSGRRMWGVYRLIAPTIELQSEYENLQNQPGTYPFSMEPDQLISLKDIFRIYRDYYQDTKYDLSQGVASGPFGNPDRFSVPYHQRKAIQTKYNNDGNVDNGAAWERPIALFRTTYTTISQARHWLDDSIGGVMWLGSYAPHATCFLPFANGVNSLPDSITQGKMTQLDRSTAFWTFRYIHSLARLRYNLLSKIIQEAQSHWEGMAMDLQHYIEKEKPKSEALTYLYQNHTAHVLEAWWKLADKLVFLYADGYDNQREDAPELGYSTEWLEAVGFQNGPPPPPPPLHSLPSSATATSHQNTTSHNNNNSYHFIMNNLVLLLFMTISFVAWKFYKDSTTTTSMRVRYPNKMKIKNLTTSIEGTPETTRSSYDSLPTLLDRRYGSLEGIEFQD